ncbi:MAG: hypothetical protein M0036_00135, partial [Desulfobacteraceae bacterium]|nr:hypothetical protein [Desulfobacteraceae bacterium]
NGVVIGDKLPGFNLGAETPLLTKSGGQNLAVVGGQFSVVITICSGARSVWRIFLVSMSGSSF